MNKPYHLWMPRMDLIKTKKVPCLHVSRCWISFLKCQHNLEGAEKKEARKKNTHTQTKDVVYEKKKRWFSLSVGGILIFVVRSRPTDSTDFYFTYICISSCCVHLNLKRKDSPNWYHAMQWNEYLTENKNVRHIKCIVWQMVKTK